MPTSEGEMNRALVPINLEKRWLLLEAALVREVLGREPWLPVPDARPELPGVLAWRGRAIPVIDLAALLGTTPLARREARARTLIVAHAQNVVALPVDLVREVTLFGEGTLHPVHAAPGPYATLEAQWGDGVLPVMDFAAFLTDLARTIAGELDANSA